MTCRRSATLLVVVGLAAGMVSPTGSAHGRQPSPPKTIKLSLYSQSESPTKAQAGAQIHVNSRRPARTGTSGSQPATTTQSSPPFGATQPPRFVYPTLPESSPLAQDATPAGPGSFWYPDGSGHLCIYQPNSDLPCFTLTTPGGQAVSGVSPQALAASAAAHVDLTAGQIDASPTGTGVTGAASWFWLDPAPAKQTNTVTLAGETVTIDATPTVSWQFGDGGQGSGPGVPYDDGSTSTDAVTHSYQTRCLAGDQGNDPDVLPSCGPHGYQVTATVTWSFTYDAHGPVSTTGTLPTRTTSSGIAYPVSEIRAFLTGGST